MKKISARKISTLKLFENARENRAKIIFLSLISVIVSLLGLARARFYEIIVDSAATFSEGSSKNIIYFSALFAFLVLLGVILSQVYKYIRQRAITDNFNNIGKSVMRALLGAKYGDFAQYHTGDILTRMFSDAKIVSENTTDIIPSLVSLSVTLFGSALYLYFISPPFCLILIFCGALLSLFAVFARKGLKRLHSEMQEAEGSLRSLYQEQLSGMLLLKVFGAEKKALSSIDERRKKYTDKTMKKQIASCVLNFGYSLACNALLLFTFFYAIYGIRRGFLTYGSLTAMLQLAANIQSSVTGLGALAPALYSAVASYERIDKILSLPKEREDKTTLCGVEKIEFKNVSFSYGRNNVIKDANLTIRKGETVAIQGASGIGKSTLLMLVLGIYAPTEGEISISDNEKITSPCRGTRKFFAFTPQGNGLFSGTLRENLLFSADNASETDIQYALKISCADEFISTLPQGLDTYIGENGAGLSEGQQQRLAIARALLSGAEVMLFDEATSALDEETEAKLIKNLGEIRKTSIIITHRKSPLSICSAAYVISENGIERVK